MTRFELNVVGLLIVVSSWQTTRACTFCPPDLRPSLLAEMDQASDTVLAKLVRVEEAEASISTYRVTQVLKGTSEIGMVIEVPLKVESPLGTLHLFLTENSDNWQNPRGVSKQMRAFLRQAKRLPQINEESTLDTRAQRLAFALPHLVSRDRQIADAAFGEFASAPNEAVLLLKPMLNPQELIAWSELGVLSAQRNRLIFMLLGVCDDQRSLGYVQSALNDRLARNESTELDAIVSTYLTLQGESALVEIERLLSPNSKAALSVRRAVTHALRFHIDGESKVKRDRLMASYRLLLNDPRTADYVLGDLARWEDWQSLETVLTLNKTAGDKRWLMRPIAEYLAACPDSRSSQSYTGTQP